MKFTDIKILTLVLRTVETFHHIAKRILLSKIATSVQTLNISWIICNKCSYFYSSEINRAHELKLNPISFSIIESFSLSAGKEDLRRQRCIPSHSWQSRSTGSNPWGFRHSRWACPLWSSPRGRLPSWARTSPGPCPAPRWSWSRRGCAHSATGSRPQPRDRAPNILKMFRLTLFL